MAEPLTSAAGLVASYFVLTGGTYKLFEKTDDVVSKEAKEKVSEWLRGHESAEGVTARVSRIFSTAFDSVFGTRLFSWRMFARSCLASMLCMLLALTMWAVLRPGEFTAWRLLWSQDRREFNVGLIGLVFGGVVNFIPDYCSLLKTRSFIGLLSRASGFPSMTAILAADACISAGLGLLTFTLLTGYFLGEWDKVLGYIWLYVLPLRADASGPPAGAFFYASFFTSFWLWLSALAAIILRFGQLLSSTRKFFAWLVKINEKPFKAIGVVALGMETVVFTVLAVVVGIRSIWHT
jgi:hypothetical protein